MPEIKLFSRFFVYCAIIVEQFLIWHEKFLYKSFAFFKVPFATTEICFINLNNNDYKKSPKRPNIKGFEGLISEKHYCSVPSSSCRENSGKPEFFLFPLNDVE